VTTPANQLPPYVEIHVSHEGRGIAGVVERLHDAGYYATVVGNMGDAMVIYGPRQNFLANRVPYVALIGDTIRVSDRTWSPQQQNQQTD
jgi:hypothetical protein